MEGFGMMEGSTNEIPAKKLTALEECMVDMREVRRNVKVSEFYGCEVFCDLDFEEGAFFILDMRMIKANIMKESILKMMRWKEILTVIVCRYWRHGIMKISLF